MAIVRWDKDQVVASEMVLGQYTTFSNTKSLRVSMRGGNWMTQLMK